jgi:hypothetical protein
MSDHTSGDAGSDYDEWSKVYREAAAARGIRFVEVTPGKGGTGYYLRGDSHVVGTKKGRAKVNIVTDDYLDPDPQLVALAVKAGSGD